MPSTENLGEKMQVTEDEFFKNGEMVFGKVLGVNRSKRGKFVEMSLLSEEEEMKLNEKRRKSLEKKKPPTKKRARLDSTVSNTSLHSINSEQKSNSDEDESEIDDEEEEDTKKEKKHKTRFVKIQEPGFDWNTAGFTMDDMASVGKERNKLDPTSWAYVNETDGKSKKAINSIKSENLKKIANSLIADAENEADFDKLVTGNPNSTDVWIKYIAFFAAKNDYQKAKTIAEQAVKAINFTDQKELFNFWTAYLNLEVLFANQESLKDVFSRACAATDSLKMHKHLAKAYKNSEKNEEAEEIFEQMIKKFRHADLEVWYMYGEHLLEVDETQKARDLLQRAIKSVEKKHRKFLLKILDLISDLSLLCRFGQLEYKHGDVQRGKTMFEKIVHTYGKKPMVWKLFIDMVLKYESIVEARKVFERAVAENSMSNKLKVIFKKWIEAEEKFGDEESQNLVRERAAKVTDLSDNEEDEKEKILEE